MTARLYQIYCRARASIKYIQHTYTSRISFGQHNMNNSYFTKTDRTSVRNKAYFAVRFGANGKWVRRRKWFVIDDTHTTRFSWVTIGPRSTVTQSTIAGAYFRRESNSNHAKRLSRGRGGKTNRRYRTLIAAECAIYIYIYI